MIFTQKDTPPIDEGLKKQPPRRFTLVRGFHDKSRPVRLYHTNDVDLITRWFEAEKKRCKLIEAEWEIVVYEHVGEPQVIVDNSPTFAHNVSYIGSDIVNRFDFIDSMS